MRQRSKLTTLNAQLSQIKYCRVIAFMYSADDERQANDACHRIWQLTACFMINHCNYQFIVIGIYLQQPGIPNFS